jgi:HSP20 family protein
MKEDPMRVTDLITRRPTQHSHLATRSDGRDPVAILQEDVNRAVGDFLRLFNMPFVGWTAALAADGASGLQLDVSETDKEVKISAEMPGIDEKDIDVQLRDGMLMISAEKKDERKADDKGYILRERTYGRIERAVPLPGGVDANAAEATFKSGVLTITVPKTREAQESAKRIAVKTS